jgi:hypothetical protein
MFIDVSKSADANTLARILRTLEIATHKTKFMTMTTRYGTIVAKKLTRYSLFVRREPRLPRMINLSAKSADQ